MKKIFILLSAVCAMSFVSCSNDDITEENENKVINLSDIKFNITVADLAGNPATKAAKTAWVTGDKINIWIDDLDVMSLKGNNVGRAELTLTYNGSSWDTEFDKFYAEHPTQGLLCTLDKKTTGVLNCLYEGTNDISNYFVNASNSVYTFTPVKWKCAKCGTEINPNDEECSNPECREENKTPASTPTNIFPLMCCADNVPYTYDEATKTITATIGGWTMLTMIQVVVPGLDSKNASKYSLSCYNVYNLNSVTKTYQGNGKYGLFYGDTEYSGCPTCGVSNADGVAFCFYDVDEYYDPTDYDPTDYDYTLTFTLSDGKDTWTYDPGSRNFETSSDAVKFIKLPSLDTPNTWKKKTK